VDDRPDLSHLTNPCPLLLRERELSAAIVWEAAVRRRLVLWQSSCSLAAATAVVGPWRPIHHV
jgi:hypothetical protein